MNSAACFLSISLDLVLHFIVVFFMFITILGISLQKFVSVYCSVITWYIFENSIFERLQ